MPPHPQPCDHCAAPCCRRYTVVLSGWDAFRIAATLKLPLREFCELRWTEQPDANYRILLSGRAEEGAEPRFHRLVLRRVPDPDPQYEGRCVFLVSIGAVGRCGVFPVRPSACAIYPTTLRAGLLGADGGGRYCPPGAWQGGLDVPAFRLAHRRRARERLVWEALVDGWNQRVVHDRDAASDQVFYDFVMNAYGALGEAHPALLRDPESIAEMPDEPAAIEAAVDRALRDLGFRTDETAAARPPGPAR